jgi:sRNA-binding protein
MLTKSEMIKLQSLLIKSSNEQMSEIGNMFNDTLNLKRTQAVRSFTVGQKVKWSSGKRGDMSGTIVKILKKNVHVQVANGDLYSVTANVLKSA